MYRYILVSLVRVSLQSQTSACILKGYSLAEQVKFLSHWLAMKINPTPPFSLTLFDSKSMFTEYMLKHQDVIEAELKVFLESLRVAALESTSQPHLLDHNSDALGRTPLDEAWVNAGLQGKFPADRFPSGATAEDFVFQQCPPFVLLSPWGLEIKQYQVDVRGTVRTVTVTAAPACHLPTTTGLVVARERVYRRKDNKNWDAVVGFAYVSVAMPEPAPPESTLWSISARIEKGGGVALFLVDARVYVECIPKLAAADDAGLSLEQVCALFDKTQSNYLSDAKYLKQAIEANEAQKDRILAKSNIKLFSQAGEKPANSANTTKKSRAASKKAAETEEGPEALNKSEAVDGEVARLRLDLRLAKDEQAATLTSLKRDHKKDLKQQLDKHNREIEELKKEHKDAIKELKKEHKHKMDQAKKATPKAKASPADGEALRQTQALLEQERRNAAAKNCKRGPSSSSEEPCAKCPRLEDQVADFKQRFELAATQSVQHAQAVGVMSAKLENSELRVEHLKSSVANMEQTHKLQLELARANGQNEVFRGFANGAPLLPNPTQGSLRFS